MAPELPRFVNAWLESTTVGIVEFDRDWEEASAPKIDLIPGPLGTLVTQVASGSIIAALYGYYYDKEANEFLFVYPLEHCSDFGCPIDPVYVAGEFNEWEKAVGNPMWRLDDAELNGRQVLMWRGAADRFITSGIQSFKFVTSEHIWLPIPEYAPNIILDVSGNTNRAIYPNRLGKQLWQFTTPEAFELSGLPLIAVEGSGGPMPINLGDFFFELKTDLPLGAIQLGKITTFRLFAPRAISVVLEIFENKQSEVFTFNLQRLKQEGKVPCVWEVTINKNLNGWKYWYILDGVREGPGAFDPEAKVLDPYALACVGREGPGIVVSKESIASPDLTFRTPQWQDLIISEAHVRDLVAKAPILAREEERRGFTGLTAWVQSPHFYLRNLGINCVELQPVQQCDSVTQEEYHWGYMTTNYFSPSSTLSLDPDSASGIDEFQKLIKAFHSQGIAVLLDVVYNHVGVPEHLLKIDRIYYATSDRAGRLMNWSGCGNDMRARASMVKRLIIDSCLHFIHVYGVDGFRFDLAELLGVEVLRDVAFALQQAKPNVVLIAEPWSFRGHIAGALRDTPWSSWNDGYRNFIKSYCLGQGSAETMEYYLKGSPWYYAKWPAQTVNYSESHDDRTWIDSITERHDGNGYDCTPNDIKRTHLMAALLFMSHGIPMISSGQDFLRSKSGLNNTYLRGDINALDYSRIETHMATHVYFTEWIDFRKGHIGSLLRLYSRPDQGFFASFKGADGCSFALLYNARGSHGKYRLLFAINPTFSAGVVVLDEKVTQLGLWKQLADEERFHLPKQGAQRMVEPELHLPALSCTLWMIEV